MAKRDSCYRHLTKTGLEAMEVDFAKIIPSFGFEDENGCFRQLKTGADQKAFYIDDKDADWDPKQNDLFVNVPLVIGKGSVLYDFGPEQVAYATSEISLALFVVSPDSADQRLLGYERLAQTDEIQTIDLKGKLANSKYHGTVVFSVFLVLTKEGEPQNGVSGINNSLGIKLGKVCSFKVRVTGDGTSFPVFEKPSEGAGLWITECNWESVANDQFDQAFKLIINPLHKDYQFIDRKSKTYCKRLENEIMAEALSDFLLRVRDEAEFADNPTAAFDEGTVGAIAQYMVETKGIDLEAKQETVLHQIVTAFEKGEDL